MSPNFSPRLRPHASWWVANTTLNHTPQADPKMLRQTYARPPGKRKPSAWRLRSTHMRARVLCLRCASVSPSERPRAPPMSLSPTNAGRFLAVSSLIADARSSIAELESRWWPGFCAPTQTPSSGVSCTSGNSGFWLLSSARQPANRTLDKEACLALCLGCARCRYVSVSSVRRECGWFYECPPLDELTILAADGSPVFGFFTASIQPGQAVPPPSLGMHHEVVTKRRALDALPAEMAAQGWVQLSPELEGRRPECARQACDSDKCAAYRHRRGRRSSATRGRRLCPCACSLCLGCAVQVDRWRSPTGQLLHSLVTATEPPFTFAYNPMDADMDKMLTDLIAEPALTIAWHVRDCGRFHLLSVDSNPSPSPNLSPNHEPETGCHLALLPSRWARAGRWRQFWMVHLVFSSTRLPCAELRARPHVARGASPRRRAKP